MKAKKIFKGVTWDADLIEAIEVKAKEEGRSFSSMAGRLVKKALEL